MIEGATALEVNAVISIIYYPALYRNTENLKGYGVWNNNENLRRIVYVFAEGRKSIVWRKYNFKTKKSSGCMKKK